VVSDRAQYWLGVGAQPTEAVEAILKITGDWQKFKGLPGTEGTLRVAEPKRDKTEIFNEALKDSANEPKSGAVTAKKTAKKAAAADEDKPAIEPKAKKAAAAQEPAAPEAPAAEEAPAEAPAAETPAEAPAAAETPAEAPAAEEAPAEAPAAEEAPAEDAPAAETPAETEA
jgi:small subunit ribosomal protein S16